MTSDLREGGKSNEVAGSPSLVAVGDDVDSNNDFDGYDHNDNSDVAGDGGLCRGQVVALGLAEGHWRICQVSFMVLLIIALSMGKTTNHAVDMLRLWEGVKVLWTLMPER